MKIDIFNHFSPKPFNDKMVSMTPDAKDMAGKRARTIPALVDLDARFRVLDMFEDYVQVLSWPLPIEAIGDPPVSGEMARLLKSTAKAVQSDRLNTVRTFAKKHKITVVLKGAYSVTAGPDGRVYVNATGNAGM